VADRDGYHTGRDEDIDGMTDFPQKMTKGMGRYYLALIKFWIEYRVPPTAAELADELGVHINAVYEALHRLEKDGWVITHQKSMRPIPIDLDDMMAEFFCYIDHGEMRENIA
jgi:hypothetical protein